MSSRSYHRCSLKQIFESSKYNAGGRREEQEYKMQAAAKVYCAAGRLNMHDLLGRTTVW